MYVGPYRMSAASSAVAMAFHWLTSEDPPPIADVPHFSESIWTPTSWGIDRAVDAGRDVEEVQDLLLQRGRSPRPPNDLRRAPAVLTRLSKEAAGRARATPAIRALIC